MLFEPETKLWAAFISTPEFFKRGPQAYSGVPWFCYKQFKRMCLFRQWKILKILKPAKQVNWKLWGFKAFSTSAHVRPGICTSLAVMRGQETCQLTVLVCWGCHNKGPQNEWLRTTEMYCLTALEAWNLGAGKAMLILKVLGKGLSPSFWPLQAFLDL